MSNLAAGLERSWLGRRFDFAAHGTTLGRDTMAGATTFIVMSYIIFLNPQILSFAGIEGLAEQGLPFNGVLASTCLIAGVMTIAMGLFTNKAFAIAPGLGLNAVVAFGLVATEGLSFPEAMGIVVMEGLLVTAMVLTGIREQVMNAIPLELKKAIAIGIGLFLAFIGLFTSGIGTTLGRDVDQRARGRRRVHRRSPAAGPGRGWVSVVCGVLFFRSSSSPRSSAWCLPRQPPPR